MKIIKNILVGVLILGSSSIFAQSEKIKIEDVIKEEKKNPTKKED